MLFDKLKETKFKSLKFGNDNPGGNTSLEPLIQVSIDDNNRVGVQKTIKDTAKENKNRISLLLTTTPRGINWVALQEGLQASNARLELSNEAVIPTINLQGSGIVAGLNKTINLINSSNTLFNNTSVAKADRTSILLKYDAGNTIAQVGGAIGDHFDRFGLTPYIEDRLKYINIAKANNSEQQNRLTKLQVKLKVGTLSDEVSSIDLLKNKIRNTIRGVASFTNALNQFSNTFGGSQFLNKLNAKVNNISKLASPFLVQMIDQYIGGPGSKFGIGTTNIRRYEFTNDLDKSDLLTSIRNNKLNSIAYRPEERLTGASQKYKKIDASITLGNLEYKEPRPAPTSKIISDTYKKLSNQVNFAKSVSYDRYAIAVAGTNVEYAYVTKEIPRVDITKFGFQKDKAGKKHHILNESGRLDGAYDRNDGEVMTVVFQLLDPFSSVNLHRILFPAYINGFRVSSDATWNPISYIGRSEDLYVYTKFKREVSFNLQIPCFNPVQLRERHRALGALESSLAGKYQDNKLGGIMTRLYIGNYLRGEVGIINSLSYDIPNDSSWDIDDQLAHNINLSINFTVVHQKLPTYRKDGGFFADNISNGANYFISSEKALNKTGANDDPFLKKITKGRFSTVTRMPNNRPLLLGNEPPEEDTYDEFFKNEKGDPDENRKRRAQHSEAQAKEQLKKREIAREKAAEKAAKITDPEKRRQAFASIAAEGSQDLALSNTFRELEEGYDYGIDYVTDPGKPLTNYVIDPKMELKEPQPAPSIPDNGQMSYEEAMAQYMNS
jgi:hypothetical protein